MNMGGPAGPPNVKTLWAPSIFCWTPFYLKRTFGLLKETFTEWSDDKAPQLGAALAYYTVFSLAPLILLLISVFSLFVHDNGRVKAQISDQVSQFAGGSAGDVVGQIIDATAKQKKSGIIGTVIAVVVALFGASGVFGQLQDALNTIWGVKGQAGPRDHGLSEGAVRLVRHGGGVCFMLLVSLSVTVLIKGFSNQLEPCLPGGAAVSAIIAILLNLVVITALFAMIFKYLPDAKIAWSDVWIGAGLTTVLFIVGKWGAGPVPGQWQRGVGLRRGGRADHDVGLGVLFRADHAFRRGVHAGVRQRVRLAHRAGGTRRARGQKGSGTAPRSGFACREISVQRQRAFPADRSTASSRPGKRSSSSVRRSEFR